MGSRRPSLNDQLDAAMAALEVSGDWYPQLMDAERSYAEQPLAVPTNLGDLRKDQLIGEGGYSLVWLVSLGPERYALKQMHKAELPSSPLAGGLVPRSPSGRRWPTLRGDQASPGYPALHCSHLLAGAASTGEAIGSALQQQQPGACTAQAGRPTR